MPPSSLPRIAVAASACALAACTLDTAGLEVPRGDGDGSPPSAPASQGPGGSDAAVPPPPSSPDGAAPPPAPTASPDAGSDASVAAEAGAPSACDADGDGHLAEGTCGGDDCCDTDARVYPGQSSYFPVSSACGSFDYDCSGKEETEHGVASCQLDWFSCKGDGFAMPTACGVSGAYTSCNYAVFACNPSSSTKVQGCR